MGTRTVQILGKAYSETGDVSVFAEFNGATIHNGVVPTTATAVPAPNTAEEVLLTFELDDTVENITAASSIAVTGGTLFVSGLAANKIAEADLAAFERLQARPKHNVQVNGVLVDAQEVDNGWHYRVDDGETITIDWVIGSLPRRIPGKPGLSTHAVAGISYEIISVGTTDFTAIGAADNNPGTVFVASGPGTGTGTISAV